MKRQAAILALAVLTVTGLAIYSHPSTVAATCNSQIVKTVSATALKDTKYSVKVSWTKNTNICAFDHWRVMWSRTSTKNTGVTVNAAYLTKTLSSLTCGKTWNFWVVAEHASNGNSGTPVKATAVPPCPVITGFTVGNSGTSIVVNWSSTSTPKASSAKIEVTGGSVTPSSPHTSTTSPVVFAGASCVTYSVYVTPIAGSQSGVRLGPLSTKTSGCPTPPVPSSGGSSSSGSTTKKSSGGSTATPAPKPAVPTPTKPAVPGDFVASLQSSKVVQLTWSAVTTTGGDASYEIDRSNDNATWSLLATTGDTSYNDTATDFNTTYYYRLKAVDVNGNSSDYATTQIATNAFTPSDQTLTSDDKQASVTIAADTFTQKVDCSFDSNAAGNAPALPKDKLLLRGPYGLLCVGEDGSTIATFDKPLKVTITLPKGSYKDFDVRETSGDEWSATKVSYDAKKHTLSFNLTAATFAAFGTKQKSPIGTIFTVFLWLLLLAAAAFGVRWFLARRGNGSTGLPSMALAGAGAAATSAVATEQFEQAALKPSCTHLNMAHQVQPQTAGCAECTAEHKHWKALRICLTCGHVGCSDDSDEQHARKHFEQTGHPLIYEYGNPQGDTIGWCYIDQTYI